MKRFDKTLSLILLLALTLPVSFAQSDEGLVDALNDRLDKYHSSLNKFRSSEAMTVYVNNEPFLTTVE